MKYVIGIDLGTTNSALAYTEIRPDDGPLEPIQVGLMGIPQLVNAAEVRDMPLLPSCVYIPGPSDFPSGSLALPWDPEPEFVTGLLAQKRGVENAGRLVAFAKSWLSHSGVDRTAPILPWNAPEGVPKLSPVEASARLLEHLREAWDSKMPGARFVDQRSQSCIRFVRSTGGMPLIVESYSARPPAT
jgi:molecular chaperone DnaK (HSP70)